MNEPSLVHRAKQFCESNKYRFTEPRERVLSLLAHSNEPMGAYQILASLSSSEEKLNPPTVYRAIEFWQKHGFIHRVESMNAYLACCGHKKHDNFCIFICDKCHTVRELKMNNLLLSIVNDMEKQHLTVTSTTTEIHGKCGQCN